MSEYTRLNMPPLLFLSRYKNITYSRHAAFSSFHAAIFAAALPLYCYFVDFSAIDAGHYADASSPRVTIDAAAALFFVVC